MEQITVVKLPSGRNLEIRVAPFAEAKALYQSLLNEIRSITFSTETEIASVLKDLFCVGFSSPVVEAKMWKCLERCTIDGVRVVESLFEAVENRDDYIKVCMEVVKSNVNPFAKSLFVAFQEGQALAKESNPQ